MITDDELELAPPAPRRSSRLMLVLLLGVVVGLIVTVFAAVAGYVLIYRETTPRLTEAAFAESRRRWNDYGPRSYNLELELSGARSGSIRVEVRSGRVTDAVIDGYRPPKRNWYIWSVPGQFDTIAREMKNAENPRQPYGVSEPSQVVMRAVFDPDLGYPHSYHRVVLHPKREASSREIRWEVTKFEVVAE